MMLSWLYPHKSHLSLHDLTGLFQLCFNNISQPRQSYPYTEQATFHTVHAYLQQVQLCLVFLCLIQ